MLENKQLHQNDFDFFACTVQHAQLTTIKEKSKVSMLTIKFAWSCIAKPLFFSLSLGWEKRKGSDLI